MSYLSNITRKIIKLPITSCHTFDLPETNDFDCSFSENKTLCVTCPIRSKFIAGERLDEHNGLGHFICIILSVLTCVVGSFGILGNLLIVLVLNRKNRRRHVFDTLLVGLAGFDLLCSVVSVIASIAAVFVFQNWSKGVMTLCFFWLPTLTALFSRSGSSFMTVLITIERYLAVAHPLKAMNWISLKRARLLVLSIAIFAFLMAFPRYSSMSISKNSFGKNIESIKHLDYIIVGTKLTKFWYVDTKGFFDQIDFWTPLPLLLIFNGLIYYHIRQLNSRRKELNVKHKRDIRAARMFLPVVIILFLCNIVPVIHYYFVFNKVVYKELLLGIFFSYVVNSAVNLPIYYYRGSSFRKDARAVLVRRLAFTTKFFIPVSDTGAVTGTTNESKSNNHSESDSRDVINMT